MAIFASAFYPHVGGVEELCRQLAHAYRRAGLGVVVVTNRWPRSLPAYEAYEGIPVYRLPLRVPEGPWQARLRYHLTHAGVRRRLLDILRRHRIDLLHVQCVSTNGYYALLARKSLQLPLIVTAQGERTMDAGRLYERSPFMNGVLRKLLDEADYVTACSRDTLEDLERYRGEAFGARGAVVYNGIRLEDFGGPEPQPEAGERPFILGIGRLVPQKGFDVLIRAFARSGVSSHDLVIAGEGPERESLERLAADLLPPGRVRFPGRADRPAAVALFRRCAFFVLPSRIEPMGIVNLEAMAAGKAVVASRVGGVPEIVHDGETGVLVPPGDVDGLAGALSRMCSSDGLRERLGSAGRRHVQRFAWPQIADQYLALYRYVIGRGSPATGLELVHQQGAAGAV